MPSSQPKVRQDSATELGGPEAVGAAREWTGRKHVEAVRGRPEARGTPHEARFFPPTPGTLLQVALLSRPLSLGLLFLQTVLPGQPVACCCACPDVIKEGPKPTSPPPTPRPSHHVVRQQALTPPGGLQEGRWPGVPETRTPCPPRRPLLPCNPPPAPHSGEHGAEQAFPAATSCCELLSNSLFPPSLRAHSR